MRGDQKDMSTMLCSIAIDEKYIEGASGLLTHPSAQNCHQVWDICTANKEED